jgi:hypothetical protein
MKLHSVLLGWSDPDQALRVSAGTPRKRASDGRWPSCERIEMKKRQEVKSYGSTPFDFDRPL